MTADEAREYGLIDEVLQEEDKEKKDQKHEKGEKKKNNDKEQPKN
jgi:hypothetical protein